MNSKEPQRTTRCNAELHDVVMPLLKAMYSEFRELSKKKPEGAVSKGKIQVVNRLLGKCREILASETSLQFLDLIDEGNVPLNSDVVLMLSQYVIAMEKFKGRFYQKTGLGFDAQYEWLIID